MSQLQLIDVLLTFTHLIIVGFNLFGWIWKPTRKAHFVVVMVTAACWLVLGIWYGLGYCPVTDWQWQVKKKLGETNLPNSFIKYWADKLTGSNVDASIIDTLTAACFTVVFILAIYFQFFKKKIKTN